jgi:hypothetical protein
MEMTGDDDDDDGVMETFLRTYKLLYIDYLI